jgi:hypothetical protein
MHRSAPRLTRILACAAVPVMLVVAGCSSDSGDDGEKTKKDSKASASATPGEGSPGTGSDVPKEPAVEPAKFAKLPEACKSVSQKTIEALLPAAKPKSGTQGRSSDLMARGSCSWNSLADQGVKGSQYRWLDVSFLRYNSEEALGVSGEQRAKDSYAKEVEKAKAADGAKNLKASAASGIGEEATLIGYQLRKTGEDFEYATVVSRTDNVVVALTFNGTGYAGAEPPTAKDVARDATRAVKDAVNSVASANQ